MKLSATAEALIKELSLINDMSDSEARTSVVLSLQEFVRIADIHRAQIAQISELLQHMSAAIRDLANRPHVTNTID